MIIQADRVCNAKTSLKYSKNIPNKQASQQKRPCTTNPIRIPLGLDVLAVERRGPFSLPTPLDWVFGQYFALFCYKQQQKY